MIQVTETAAKQITNLLSDETDKSKTMLRVKVVPGGCSGKSYKMDFESDQTSDDKVFEHNGVKIVVDQKSLLHLMGMTLDFEGGLNGQGFVFNNPNAKANCGCGSSFAV